MRPNERVNLVSSFITTTSIITKKIQEIIAPFKEEHFLVGNSIFLISWSDLYDLFNLDALDISLMRCFTL
jgi:hypothetical protein